MLSGELVAVLGPVESSQQSEGDDHETAYSWQAGTLSAAFRWEPELGETPNTVPAFSIQVWASWDGADPDGLTAGISARCFLDLLGEPSYVSTYPDDEPHFTDICWDDPDVHIGVFSDYPPSEYEHGMTKYVAMTP